MAGFSTIFVIGGEGGFLGADGVNPIELFILLGHGNRMWFEARYPDPSIKPLGGVSAVVPRGPDDPDALLDACIAFAPHYFKGCPSLGEVERALQDAKGLDFDAGDFLPAEWATLREEARPVFREMKIWQANLVPIKHRSR
jgi:hypothetical protein